MKFLETKAAISADDAGLITGLAWPFGTPDREGDVIVKGAFSRPATLPMLYAHDPGQPVGVWDDFAETDEGLEVKGRLLIAGVERAREIHALVQAGGIRGLSIGFTTKAATGRKGYGRTIQALDLQEISLVTVPCHPGARVRSVKAGARAIAIAEAINRAALAFRT